MNLASFYLCLCMHINSLITLLWHVISWETKTTINMQVYASRIVHAQRHICFWHSSPIYILLNSIYLLLASLFLENLPGEANVLIPTRNVPLFFILFSTFKFFRWSIFDMQLIYLTWKFRNLVILTENSRADVVLESLKSRIGRERLLQHFQENPAHALNTPQVHPLSHKLEWTD